MLWQYLIGALSCHVYLCTPLLQLTVDSLDMLLLLNRRGDIQDALTKLRNALDFDKDIKVGGSRASWTRDQQQPGPGRGQPLG